MIPLSRHQLIVHQGRSTPLPTIWYEHLEVLSAYVESRKLFLDVSLGRALAMEWVSRIFLEAAICVGGNLTAYVGRGYPRQCHEEQAYSAVEKKNSANAVVRTVAG